MLTYYSFISREKMPVGLNLIKANEIQPKKQLMDYLSFNLVEKNKGRKNYLDIVLRPGSVY